MEPKLILPNPEKQSSLNMEQIEGFFDKNYLEKGLADKALSKLKGLLDSLRQTK